MYCTCSPRFLKIRDIAHTEIRDIARAGLILARTER
jgi:hypothetical protein